MLEKMGEFFDARLNEYDRHQLECIEGAEMFYPYTAECLPEKSGVRILDLGCGTGLELEEYLKRNLFAEITGIDLAPGMLESLKKKFSGKNITLITGSYFEVPFENHFYDAAVSVESLHHFTKEQKIPLYAKLYNALKPDGYFLLTDYFSMSEEEEKFHREELQSLKKRQGIEDDEFYHYDTPLTVPHEIQALKAGGFTAVEILRSWGQTYTLKAMK